MSARLSKVAAAGLAALLVGFSGADGHTSGANGPTVSITAVPGYAGHAFVYAQVSDSGTAYPAPSGRGHQSPFYASWTRQPFGASSCPWIWVVYVFSRSTNQQVNALPPSAPQPNFGTTTWFCASPATTPVEEPPVPDARARLDLDLRVALSPSRPTAGTPALVTGRLTATLTQDLNLYLNMAIQDWSASSWSVDFGDGSGASIPGRLSNQLDVRHTYSSAGSYDARVVATISGHAQAARYDGYGAVSLVRQSFSVEIGNHTLATAAPRPQRTYVPPQAQVAVGPALDGTPDPAAAFRHVDSLRGAITSFTVKMLVVQEAQIRSEGRVVGRGTSRLTRWRYDGQLSSAPNGTRPGQVQDVSVPLRLQWNDPDQVVGKQLQDYTVPLTLYVETRFQDGHLAQYVLSSSFLVTVDFAAQSG